MPTSEYDLFIYNACILTMDRSFKDFLNGYLFIKDAKIVAIGSMEELEVNPKKIAAKEKIDAQSGILLPGFVNSHSHFAMSLFRGLADDLALHEWLNNYIWPLEANLQEEYCLIGTQLAAAEMILSGTTCACDMYFYEHITLKALETIGFRGILGHGMLDFGENDKRQQEFSEVKKFISLAEREAKLCSVIISPHAPNTCSEELLLQAKQLAMEKKLALQIHLAETKKEYDDSINKLNKTPTRYLHDIGFLCDKLVAAHAIWLDTADYDLLKENQVKIAHNPSSNLKLASGVLDYMEYQKRNIIVSLGTDSAASNNNLSMFKEMRHCALLHKGVKRDPTILPARSVLQMATINGAKALGVENKIGSLEIGKLADLILLDVKSPHLWPPHDPYSLIVYAANESDVNTTIINGQIVMKNRQLQTINLSEILHNSKEAITKLLKGANLQQFQEKLKFL